jgi:ABC-type amino acid transport substrate-binding protein
MKWFALLLLSAACLMSSACGRSNKLIIATDATYPPFEVLDEKGEFSGADIDMGRELAKYLGKDVEFRNINFDGLIAALKSGSVDMVISAMTANDERRKSIDFSDPYVKTGLAILANAKSPVNGLEDLKAPGRRVVARLGTTGAAFLQEHLPNATVVTLDSDTACVMEVVRGFMTSSH